MRKPIHFPKVDLSFNLLLVAMAIGVIWSGVQEEQFLSRARHAQGTVVSVKFILRKERFGPFYRVYLPTISYKDAADKSWTYVPEDYSRENGRIGTTVPIVYDPAVPGNAQIGSFWGEWESTLYFGYVGALAFVMRWICRQAPAARTVSPRGPAIPATP